MNKIIRTKQPPIKFGNQDNQEQVQEYIRQQIYSKGFEFNATPGANSFSVVLGGAAKRLYGLIVFVDPNFANDGDIMSLTINNELVIDNVVWWAYNPQGAVGNIFKDAQYFKLPRPLSGSDSVQLGWKANNAHKIYPIFYLADQQ